MKIAIREFGPFQILFIRFGIASILIIPILISVLKNITLQQLKHGIIAGLLFSGNVFFIMIGIQYTTSIVSQLFYLLTPLFVSLAQYFLFREKISFRRVVSMIICFGGSAFLVLSSLKGTALIQSIGTIHGNLLVLCAVLCWSSYVVLTKRIGKAYTPSFFLVFGFMTAVIASIIFLLSSHISPIQTVARLFSASPVVIASLVTLGVVNSVLFFFLYQWSLKRVSAFIVASTTYLAPLSAATFAIPFFGEKLSTPLIVAALSIFLGSYLILTEKR
jgi:drug/metabolite transporter (DMT)-like permease